MSICNSEELPYNDSCLEMADLLNPEGRETMEYFIAAGFQNTVDFELEWNRQCLEELVRQYEIRSEEICAVCPIESERDLLRTLLYHMANGTGSECLCSSSRITRGFAQHFNFQVTLGGTALRAAMALEKIGYRSVIHACSLNKHFRRLVPEHIRWVSSVADEGEDFHPHVILQYPADARIAAGDIDLTTRRPNRVIFAHDPPSIALHINEAFGDEVCHAPVLLAASYNIIKEEDVLRRRLESTIRIIERMPQPHMVVMEDACFEDPRMQQIVVQTLAPHLNVFSMNEDELQDRLGHRIDVRNPQQVAAAVRAVYPQLKVPTIVCHSAYWALAYGQPVQGMRAALEAGICMASTRFRLGDNYTRADYCETMALPNRAWAKDFAARLELLLGQALICVPGKDLDHITQPVTIGLGDAFIGGMLPCFLTDAQRRLAEF